MSATSSRRLASAGDDETWRRPDPLARPFPFPSILSLQHDKACEIFAQIKGGVVDYGEQHSEEHGHSRYGRAYPGLYPEWSDEHPVHLVGHSLGGTTARMLQHLLHKKAFAGFGDTSAGWVSSITAINSPLNGALGAYALGLDQQTLEVRTLSCGWLLGRAAHLAGYLGVAPLGLEHWRLAWWEDGALSTLCGAMVGRSSLVDGRDNAASDTSIHSVAALNALLGPGHPDTYHLTFVGDGATAGAPPKLEEFDGGWLAYALALSLFAFRRLFLVGLPPPPRPSRDSFVFWWRLVWLYIVLSRLVFALPRANMPTLSRRQHMHTRHRQNIMHEHLTRMRPSSDRTAGAHIARAPLQLLYVAPFQRLQCLLVDRLPVR